MVQAMPANEYGFPSLTELLSPNVKNKYSAVQKTYKLFAGKFACLL